MKIIPHVIPQANKKKEEKRFIIFIGVLNDLIAIAMEFWFCFFMLRREKKNKKIIWMEENKSYYIERVIIRTKLARGIYY